MIPTIRSRKQLKKDASAAGGGPVARLTDMLVEEVSIVDRGANKRKLLIVKSHSGATGPEVVPAPDGTLTAVTKAPGDEATTTTPTATQTVTDPPAPVEPPAEPSTPAPTGLRLSPEAKAELGKRFAGAIEAITKLAAMVNGAEEVQGVGEVPQEIVDGVGALVTELGSGVTPVAKGRKQISIVRENQLRGAFTALQAIISELDAVPEPPPAEQPAPVAPEAAPAESPVVKALEDRVKKTEGVLLRALTIIEKQATDLEAQKVAIAKQAGRVDNVARVRAVSNAGVVESDHVPVAKADEEFSWPMDMNGSGNAAKGAEIDFASR